jgi:GT2 family glycosyltransferase
MRPNLHLTVVIPFRDRLDRLEELLRELAAQEYPREELEILACDDGSRKDPWPTIAHYASLLPHLRLLQQPPKGPAAVRNLGIRESRAPLILFLDSDVLPAPGLLKALALALIEHPHWLGAEAKIERIGQEGPLWDGPSCLHGGRYHTAAIAYRREALIQAGGFEEAFPFPACEDVELAYRILQRGPIGFVPQAVAYHPTRPVSLRIHWHWRCYWRYETILAKRHGFISFPENPSGRFPRMRVAWTAIFTLPMGRIFQALKYLRSQPGDALWALGYGVFDVFCGIWALPNILGTPIPPVRNYFTQRPRGNAFRSSVPAGSAKGWE